MRPLRHRIGGLGVCGFCAGKGHDIVRGRRRGGRFGIGLEAIGRVVVRTLVAGAAAEHGVEAEQQETRHRDQHNVQDLRVRHHVPFLEPKPSPRPGAGPAPGPT